MHIYAFIYIYNVEYICIYFSVCFVNKKGASSPLMCCNMKGPQQPNPKLQRKQKK